MPKENAKNDALFVSLFDFDDPKPRNRYLVVMERAKNQYVEIVGLQTTHNRCFHQPVDLEETVCELNAHIKAWQRVKNNAVTVKVYPVKRPDWEDFVLYVQIVSPSFTRATKHVPSRLVPERDHEALITYIKGLTEEHAYPRLTKAQAWT